MNQEKKINLILENQQAIMNAVNLTLVSNTQGSGDIQRQIISSYEKTREALSPQSDEFDYVKDIEEPEEEAKLKENSGEINIEEKHFKVMPLANEGEVKVCTCGHNYNQHYLRTFKCNEISCHCKKFVEKEGGLHGQ